jgi:16S rRNA (uracil1498-N3)-methyltransferase
MKVHRFITETRLTAGPLTLTDAALVHQIKDVLRLDVGEELVLCDGKANEASGRIVALRRHEIDLTLAKPVRVASEPARRVTLYCAVLKRENFETACQKATEVGVSAVVPIITARTVKTSLRLDRLATIIKEAAEQSGRGVLPRIQEPIAFAQALDSAHDRGWIFVPGGTPFDGDAAGTTDAASVWIGPEGGWEGREIAVAQGKGLTVAGLGPLVLRAETAVTVASYLALHA